MGWIRMRQSCGMLLWEAAGNKKLQKISCIIFIFRIIIDATWHLTERKKLHTMISWTDPMDVRHGFWDMSENGHGKPQNMVWR